MNNAFGEAGDAAARPAYVSRQRALEILGVKPQTLYSYVSRGLVRRRVERGGRPSYYNFQDIQRLKSRSVARSGHGPAAANAIHWGEPVLGTGITEITERGPVYREHLALDLALANHRFEAVAEYLWTGAALTDDVIWSEPAPTHLAEQLGEIIRSRPKIHIRQLLTEVTLLLGIEQGDPESSDRAETACEQARRLMHAMIGVFGFLGPARRYVPAQRGDTVAGALVRALGIRPSVEVTQALDRLLVIVADHEFTPATFAARIAASAGSDLYSCVGAALQVHFGAALGLRCDQLEQSLRDTDAADDPRTLTGPMSRDLEHPLYREGDPRAAALMEIVAQLPRHADVTNTAPPPSIVNLDYALVTLCQALGAVPQAAGGLLAFGRTAGWIAHVLEQRGEEFVIRPRARFIRHGSCEPDREAALATFPDD
jgi:citrate synthase